MPTRTSWIVPGHVFLLTLSGIVTLEELTPIRAEIKAALEAATKLHYLIDLRTLQDIPNVEGLRYVLGRSGSFRHSKTGSVAILGGSDDAKLIFKSAATALHLRLGIFEDEDQALNFLAEADI